MIDPLPRWTKEQARAHVGGLSEPSKMPGWGASTSAHDCITGSKLAKVAGSTCEHCYAKKGHYAFPNVQDALKRRLKLLRDPLWVPAMVRALAGEEWFRWHDSGDLQGEWHLENIFEVARQTPHVQHWLPTREFTFVRQVLKKQACPPNLTIRLSEHMMDKQDVAKALAEILGVTSSSVESQAKLEGRHCPAPTQGNKCGECRSCWDKTVPVVVYHKH